jgi:hypothetical protein
MSEKTQPTHEMPGGQTECTEDDGVVNDSMGTVDPADFSGIDDKEVKDAGNPGKRGQNKRED